MAVAVSNRSEGPAPGPRWMRRLLVWEELLTLLVDPESSKVQEREARLVLLNDLLGRAGIDRDQFWSLAPARRSRAFLEQYSRASRGLPRLEISSFDLDKAAKERFRSEPLTLGAAWHYGIARSYFSHAAITHPANDGLREEFSTGWDILHKVPALLTREPEGRRLQERPFVHVDLPILVGPMPHSDGLTIEQAYLEAIRSAESEHDVHVETRVLVHADHYRMHEAYYHGVAERILVRIPVREFVPNDATQRPGGWELVRGLVRTSRIVEIEVSPEWNPGVVTDVLRRLHEEHPDLLISVFLRYDVGFWKHVHGVVQIDGVAMLHVQSGAEKSYRLVPAVDQFLKSARCRTSVQLVTAGGDTDTLASAASVYEAVLLGANGGSVTHLAEIALSPDLADVARDGDSHGAMAALAERDPKELAQLALSSLTCWQHSILDFLSCMGIDDVQKTSGNTMAITMTEDWAREVNALATPDFGALNRELNQRLVRADLIPKGERNRYRVSRLQREIVTDLPLVAAARILAHRNANYHLMNSNRNLTADHLNVIYQMAAGRFPEVDDFFVEGDPGPLSLDHVGVRLSRRAVEQSLQRLRKDPMSLDYINLCVPRGFQRPGAVPSRSRCTLTSDLEGQQAITIFEADPSGGFRVAVPQDGGGRSLYLQVADVEGNRLPVVELAPVPKVSGDPDRIRPAPGAPPGVSIRLASANQTILLKPDPRGGFILEGVGVREPLYTGPVHHASISLGAAGEDFLITRVEGNAGLALTSSGEGGPIRLPDEVMAWESLQAASGHFGILGADLRRVRDVEIKINQGAKPGKGGRLSGLKVTPTVSRARNIPVGTDALSPDPKHDIYSIEDMPSEVWLWLHYGVHCGIKITGSTYTQFVAAGMWSNFVVDYLLIDAGLGGSGNYHADSSRVGWPDLFRTILHTHHALVQETLYDDENDKTWPIRDLNGGAFGAGGGTRLLGSGGIRSEMDMLKVFLAGADGLLEASIGKAVAFGCNQCGNCHLDCPRGGITTKAELTIQNDRGVMRQRFRNWTVLNMIKLAVLMDALNRELGYVDEAGRIVNRHDILDDIRKLRGRTDLLVMPEPPPVAPPIEVPHVSEFEPKKQVSAQYGSGLDETTGPSVSTLETGPQDPPRRDHGACRVASLLVTDRVDVGAIWEAARLSSNGGNNRGGGILFAGFAPEAVRRRTCIFLNTIGPDRAETMQRILEHLEGVRFFDAGGHEMEMEEVRLRLPEFRVPVRPEFTGEGGWQRAGLRENVGDVTMLFCELRGDTLWRYGERLLASDQWLQRRVKYGDLPVDVLRGALEQAVRSEGSSTAAGEDDRLAAFVRDVKEEYFTVLAHIIDTRFYRTDGDPRKCASRRSGFVVSMGEDLGAIKVSGWTHLIPTYFDFDQFWSQYPGAREVGGIRVPLQGEQAWTTRLVAHVWGMHHRYPTNSPAVDAEGRGNPAGAHPFKSYNLLLMHNGEQVGVDSTAPLLTEHGYLHADDSMGEGAKLFEGDSIYERKALTDTEYAAYLVDFTRRVLGLETDDATQIISPITGIDLEAVEPPERRERYRALSRNYIHLTPTGPYKFTMAETREVAGTSRVGFRENMDIKFLRPHEIGINWDTSVGGVRVIANGSEAKIVDAMVGALRQQAVLGDGGTDMRFNMRPGGRPGTGETGGVFEAFLDTETNDLRLGNRFGEPMQAVRAGTKPDPMRGLPVAVSGSRKKVSDEARARLEDVDHEGLDTEAARERFVRWILDHLSGFSFDEYRFMVEWLLPRFAANSGAHCETALWILTELRKRLHLADTGGKSLAALEYFTDGGFEYDGEPEGGIYRLLTAVPPLWRGPGPYARIQFETRADLVPPTDPSQVLVMDMRGFASEAFGLEGAARFFSHAVGLGWRRLVGYNHRGGPRYIGTNMARPDGTPAQDVRLDLYGRQFGDFMGALLEGAEIRCYGQGQSHVGMKADHGSIFVLQDILNTGLYTAHGGTLSVWDSGSRFAAAGQNRVVMEDGTTMAPGLKSIHFGSPNEYAFEYLMSGGENSLHVVLGLEKPNARGHLRPRPRPYAGKFFMSGAAAGRVYVFDPDKRMEKAQAYGNATHPVQEDDWDGEVGPFIAAEAAKRGLPIEIIPGGMRIAIDGEPREYACGESFTCYSPIRIPKSIQRQGVAPPALVGMLDEL